MRVLAALLLSVLCLLSPSSLVAQEIKTLADLQQHWARHREAFAAVTVHETFVVVSHWKDGLKSAKQSHVKFEFRRNGARMTSLNNRRTDRSRISLINEHYSALIKEPPAIDEPWTLEPGDLLTATKEGDAYQKLAAGLKSNWRPPALVGFAADVAMLDPRWCKIVSITTEPDGLVKLRYTLDPRLSDDKEDASGDLTEGERAARQLLELQPEGEFYFDPKFGYAIAKFEARNGDRGFHRTEQLSDYRLVEGVGWYPYRIEVESSFTKARAKSVAVYEPIVIATGPVPESTFFLSHYGIPEPEGITPAVESDRDSR